MLSSGNQSFLHERHAKRFHKLPPAPGKVHRFHCCTDKIRQQVSVRSTGKVQTLATGKVSLASMRDALLSRHSPTDRIQCKLSMALALTSCRHASHLETCALAFHKGLTLYTEHAGSDTLSLTQDHTRSQNALGHSGAMELLGCIRGPPPATPVQFCNGNTTPMS